MFNSSRSDLCKLEVAKVANLIPNVQPPETACESFTDQSLMPFKEGNIPRYYTPQAVRGPITKINQSKCSITGPIFSKHWTGHCPE